MGTRIVIFCDPCDAEGTDAEAAEVSIALDGGPNRRIALCPVHDDAILKPLKALLDEYGTTEPGIYVPPAGERRGRPAKPTTPREECLWCGETYSDTGYVAHLRKAHALDGRKGAHGERCPICGDQVAPAGLLVHCRSRHAEQRAGWEASSQPFLWARDNGDPHGIYAERRALAPVSN